MIYALVNDCIESEKERGLAKATLKELIRYLHEFAEYYQSQINCIEGLTPDFLRQYVEQRGKGLGSDLIKAVVWSLRKFGAFLVLRNILSNNPAKPLRHPRISPRSQLPKYLSVKQLRTLLHSAAERRNKRDFAVLALICSTGMRPSSVAALKRSQFIASQYCIIEKTKGGGLKRTALNEYITAILQEYMATRSDDCSALFLSDRGRPVSISWIQRMVKQAGQEARLSHPVTCSKLRHTFAVHAADRHGKILTKALLGHQRLATTCVYTHLSARHFRALMNMHPYRMISCRSLQ